MLRSFPPLKIWEIGVNKSIIVSEGLGVKMLRGLIDTHRLFAFVSLLLLPTPNAQILLYTHYSRLFLCISRNCSILTIHLILSCWNYHTWRPFHGIRLLFSLIPSPFQGSIPFLKPKPQLHLQVMTP